MLRLRRYRVFLVLAFFAVAALYRFGSSATAWREAAGDAATRAALDTKPQLEPKAELEVDTQPRPAVAFETESSRLDIPVATQLHVPQTPPPVQKVPTPVTTYPSIPSPRPPLQHDRLVDGGVLADDQLSSTARIPPIYWSKLPEKFPVASSALLRLPTGKPKPVPKIQFPFKPESEATKVDRLAKLDIIRGVAKKSWDNYKQFAWLHDELKPESGTFRDPFAHWGATLVDSLDTLWIMGLKKEFEEAVKAVDHIAFTTTERPDIPMFETTIRYLGGLIAAYDISGSRYKTLLDKAIELAELLISAFDTPNRMPDLYYYWRPQFASQSHRASKNAVLAEVGSLSLEFTRLAQITGEDKYYDAIARITDNLEAFQMKSKLPGMWPTKLDISGCSSVYHNLDSQSPLTPSGDYLDNSMHRNNPTFQSADKVSFSPNSDKQGTSDVLESDILASGQASDESAIGSVGTEKYRISSHLGDGTRQKRQVNLPEELAPAALEAHDTWLDEASPAGAALSTPPMCIPQGIKSSTRYGRETYTLGGESDSTYEYLPKQYLLLGGQVEKYRTMYENSVAIWKKHLFFRPMIPNNEDILFSGKFMVSSETNETVGDLIGQNEHLTCFVGGMLGLGAKIFKRSEDLEVAKKLTEGCVWSYNMTVSGIMPESFTVLPCHSTEDCAWNQTRYGEALDPMASYRQSSYEKQLEEYQSNLASASAWYEAELTALTAQSAPLRTTSRNAEATPMTSAWADTLDRRQLPNLEDDPEIAHAHPLSPIEQQLRDEFLKGKPEDSPPTKVHPILNGEDVAPPSSAALPQFPYLMSPYTPISHQDYVQSRIQEERLPPGVVSVDANSYILRPEAIESVWYMYRITGSTHWREAGWRMFQAINKHTSTTYGNSAIDDVTKAIPLIKDEMESFWLAETLKYFYLLFSEEDVVSLDEWVLNTEAHPFKRPT